VLLAALLLSAPAAHAQNIGVQAVDIVPGSSGSSPFNFYADEVGEVMYFTADDDVNGREPWVSDGTVGGTRLLRDIDPGSANSSPIAFARFGDFVYFDATGPSGDGLWRTDGTTDGTTEVSGAVRGARDLTVVGSDLFFSAEQASVGTELFVTDGTAAGTRLVQDISPGFDDSFPDDLTAFDGLLYFEADDGTTGGELWRSDGTEAGTRLVKDIEPGTSGGYGDGLTVYDGLLYFEADDGTTGGELWRSDGTEAGTVLFADINPAGNASVSNLTVANGYLFFTAFRGDTGGELWRTDGTEAGTILLRDIRPGNAGSDPRDLTVVEDVVYFSAVDGAGFANRELWRSDGTPAGTFLVEDIRPGPDGSGIDLLTAAGERLFFQAFADSSTGLELYVLQNGVVSLVEDLVPGFSGSDPEQLTALGRQVFFVPRSTQIAIGREPHFTTAPPPPPLDLLVTESITVTDAVRILPALLLLVQEAITVQDDVSVLEALQLLIQEAIGVQDDVSVLEGLQLLVQEAIGVNDNLTLRAGNITLQTLRATSDGDLAFDAPIAITVALDGIEGSDDVTALYFPPPGNRSGDDPVVSSFRWILTAGPDLTFGAETALRFRLGDFPIAFPDPALLTVLRRTAPGEGEFEPLPTAYDADTNELVASGVGAFGEFALDLGQPVSNEDGTGTPQAFALHGAAPNPFMGRTSIGYDVAEAARVQIVVYDVLGRRVRTLVDEDRTPGRYRVTFDASGLTSGIYLYRMQAESFSATHRVILTR
jgi:ELWxxDGT repeat protein